jgi:hypothetical protein
MGMSSPTQSDQRFATAERLVKLFWPERFAYLALSLLTAAVVIYAGVQIISDRSHSETALGLLFGSGGIVAFNIGRLLVMFNRVLKVVFG